jgi:hypothetical protein
MNTISLSEGTGRTKISLSAQLMGKDLIVCIFNEQGHLGAVAVSEYSEEEKRASTSVITRRGHKDDSVAYRAAYELCKHLKEPVCVIAGIHVDHITSEEITQITRNCDRLVDTLSGQLAFASSQ